MNRGFSFLFLVFALWLLWLIFAGRLDSQEILAGGIVAVIVALLGSSRNLEARPQLLNPRRILYALAYLPYLLWSIVLSNFDVARRVLSPKLDINPGIVKVRTRLENPVGRLILANSITLTPGTLTVDIVDDHLYIHWIDVTAQDVELASRRIAASFERFLEVIFD